MIKHIFLILVIFVSYFLWNQRPVKHGFGITAPEQPVLVKVNRHAGIDIEHYTLKPTWEIETTARVLSQKRYWFDEKTHLSPIDFVLGWGQLSDERILSQIKTPIHGREFDLNVIRPPLTLDEIRQHLLFMHAVPSSESVSEQLKNIRPGNIITIQGYIVDINDRSDLIWKSSFTDRNSRLDGNQIVYIDQIEVL